MSRGNPRAGRLFCSQIDCSTQAENAVYVLWYRPGEKKFDCMSGALILSEGASLRQRMNNV
jgi:hypothetical protein